MPGGKTVISQERCSRRALLSCAFPFSATPRYVPFAQPNGDSPTQLVPAKDFMLSAQLTVAWHKVCYGWTG
ncbi:MAG: hypothetical protein AMXMBFR84_22390 [Candidatus Hydrogenedentota bacterium]